MSAASFWDAFVWARFSKPRWERPLYQRVQRTQPVRIVELGIGNATRATRIIRLAQRLTDQTVHYCGVDLFEARATGGLPLKEVHNQLAKTGAKVRLVPGDMFSALGRTANILTQTDLLVIDACQTQDEIERAFHFFPRMLHEKSCIARFDRQGQATRLRWLKPAGFLQNTRKAA